MDTPISFAALYTLFSKALDIRSNEIREIAEHQEQQKEEAVQRLVELKKAIMAEMDKQ